MKVFLSKKFTDHENTRIRPRYKFGWLGAD